MSACEASTSKMEISAPATGSPAVAGQAQLRSAIRNVVNVELTQDVNTWLTVILTLTMEKDRAGSGNYPDWQAGISLFLLREVANGGKDARRGTRRVHLR